MTMTTSQGWGWGLRNNRELTEYLLLLDLSLLGDLICPGFMAAQML